MSKIHQLSDELVAKIAAGEVVEKPAYAVKELIENALDAKANEIGIFLEEGGLKKIQVTDNGEGMSKDDLELSWKPHTTSKINEKSSLHAIKSFGFRGEALASLAAVSQLTIRSKTKKDTVGHEITIQDAKVVKSIPVGMPFGTTITAENLFSHIPARKKFLRNRATELRHSIDIIHHFAISNPKVRFSLKHNNKTLSIFPATASSADRVHTIMGTTTFSLLLPIKVQDSYVSISGFIGKPQLSSSTQSKQILFINKRKVTNKIISLAVKEAFGTMLESTMYPIFVLFLDVPFEMVDVNIHPRKEQIDLLNNKIIFQTIKDAVMQLLAENNITFQNLSWKRTGVGMTTSFAGRLFKETVLDKDTLHLTPNSSFFQFNKVYIVASAKQSLLLIDQHAAHERILFEKLSNEFLKQKKKQKKVQLKTPVVLHFSLSENKLLQQHRYLLEKIGYTIVFPKNNTSVITHMPFLFQDRVPQEMLGSLLQDLEENISLKKIDKISEEMLAFLACRAAVKAGDFLTESEMKNIVEELEITKNNATCPHGRPTQIMLPISDINSLFKR